MTAIFFFFRVLKNHSWKSLGRVILCFSIKGSSLANDHVPLFSFSFHFGSNDVVTSFHCFLKCLAYFAIFFYLYLRSKGPFLIKRRSSDRSVVCYNWRVARRELLSLTPTSGLESKARSCCVFVFVCALSVIS